jgi:hypothetical protein
MAKNTATAGRRGGASRKTRTRRSDAARQKDVGALQHAVEAAVGRLQSQRLLRPGTIVFRAADGETPIFALRSSEHGATVEQSAGDAAPLLEVIGDPRRIGAIVRGEKDARLQFFAGGIRVRGDMQYLSELGMQLGFLKKPLV